MERMGSIDNRAGFSASAPETDGDQAERAAENCPNNNSSGNLSNRPGQSLLAITSMVPSSTSLYKVEIEFPAKKVGQLDLREGEYATIRQSFDDGWVGCHLMLFILSLLTTLGSLLSSGQRPGRSCSPSVHVCMAHQTQRLLQPPERRHTNAGQHTGNSSILLALLQEFFVNFYPRELS